MITIAKLAADYNAQPYEVAAALDLGRVDDDHEVDETFAREVLDMLASEKAAQVTEEALRFRQGELDHAEQVTDERREARNASVCSAVAAGITQYRVAQIIGKTPQAVAKIVDADRQVERVKGNPRKRPK